MKQKIKILIFASIFLLGSVAISVSAVTINSSTTVVSESSIVSSLAGFFSYNGNVCPAYCPISTNQYSQTEIVNGVPQGTNTISCVGVSTLVSGCENRIEKTSTDTCTYTTGVNTWGTCSQSGVQFATSFSYNTVPGSSCVDQAPVSQPCAPTEPIIAICPYISSPESPVININGGLNRTSPSIRGLYSASSEFYITQNIPAGTYLVETISWDGYPTRATVTPQPFEQWNLQFYKDAALLEEIGPTTDIIDLVVQDTRTNTFGPIILTQDTNKLRFFHFGYPTVSGSVVPVCVKLSRQDTATPDPTLTFNAIPSTIASGNSADLTWTSTNVVSCEASGGWSGNKAVSGIENVSPTVYTEYYLECKNSIGVSTGKRMASVDVIGSNLSVVITAVPSDTAQVGAPIKWTASASGGSGVYTSFAWTGATHGLGTMLGTSQNFIEDTIGVIGTATVHVTVTDSNNSTATDSYDLEIESNVKPQ